MDRASIRHEATQRWCFSIAPGRFVFRLQTKKDDMRSVTLHSRDKYLPLKLKDTRKATPMVKVACDGLHDYYEAELSFQVVCLRYCFELEAMQGNRVFFSNSGFTSSIPEDNERLFDCPQTLREEERFSVPAWAANKVVYQIFPSRFASHKPVSDRIWYKSPIGPKDNLGGSLQGITQRLGHIRDLGVDVLYLTPIFYSHSTHKYDTADYTKIDPMFGGEEAFRSLVNAAKKYKISIILDGVFSHTGDDSIYFNKYGRYDSIGAFNSQSSPYYKWYKFINHPEDYHSWWGISILPEVIEESPEFIEFITGENGIVKKWLDCGASGFRLDVADELPDKFIDALSSRMKALNKNWNVGILIHEGKERGLQDDERGR